MSTAKGCKQPFTVKSLFWRMEDRAKNNNKNQCQKPVNNPQVIGQNINHHF
jgi:hypothetical protein